MPKANIEQAIRKGSSKEAQSTDNATVMFYEGLGPNGVACIVEALTNNRNKTFNEVRHVFYEYGSLTAVSYLFRRSGFVLVECATNSDGDALTNDAIDTGLALDVQEGEPGQWELECEIKDVLSLKRLMEE
jgi:transcriptional/translational regulatory protein YebC/TACO1